MREAFLPDVCVCFYLHRDMRFGPSSPVRGGGKCMIAWACRMPVKLVFVLAVSSKYSMAAFKVYQRVSYLSGGLWIRNQVIAVVLLYRQRLPTACALRSNMVQGKIVRPAPRMMDREALQHLAEQQQKAIDAVTADLYDAHIMTNRPLPKAMDFSWCLTTSREPEAVEPPMSSSYVSCVKGVGVLRVRPNCELTVCACVFL